MMTDEPTAGPVWRVAWRRRWAEWRQEGTNGTGRVTSGDTWRPFFRALPVVVALIALVDTVNVLSALHDAARRGDGLAAWEPITWEATSGIAEVIACPVIYVAFVLAMPLRDRWRRTLPVHVSASLAFSAMHLLLMMALRTGIYRAAGYHYRVEAGAALYEYRKDLLAYLVIGGVLYLFRQGTSRVAPLTEITQPELLVIGDGRRTWHLRPDDVLALRSAGNYVEFLLADKTRPLVRTTLTIWERRLAPAGFVRTHRSWLLNPRRVRHIDPTGSGDYAVTLGDGVVVPLSRRFAAVLDALKQSPT